MQRDTQDKARIAKRIIIIAIVSVAVIAIGISVALLLKNISNLGPSTNNSPDTTAPTQQAPSAQSVIETYGSPGTIRVLTDDFTAQKPVAPARIVIKAADYDYEVSVATEHSLLFVANDTREIDRTAAVVTQTTDYLTSKGYSKSGDSTAERTTYTYGGAACQLTNNTAGTPVSYLIACADKLTVDDEYQSIEDLLTLYKAKHQLDNITRAITTTVKEDDKTMTILNLTTKHNQYPRLLFAAIKNKWEYLGNIGQGSAATSNGKYTLTPDVRAVISNPKYGDFLLKQLE